MIVRYDWRRAQQCSRSKGTQVAPAMGKRGTDAVRLALLPVLFGLPPLFFLMHPILLALAIDPTPQILLL